MALPGGCGSGAGPPPQRGSRPSLRPARRPRPDAAQPVGASRQRLRPRRRRAPRPGSRPRPRPAGRRGRPAPWRALSSRTWRTSADLKCQLIGHQRAPSQRTASISSTAPGSLRSITATTVARPQAGVAEGRRHAHAAGEDGLAVDGRCIEPDRRAHGDLDPGGERGGGAISRGAARSAPSRRWRAGCRRRSRPAAAPRPARSRCV